MKLSIKWTQHKEELPRHAKDLYEHGYVETNPAKNQV